MQMSQSVSFPLAPLSLLLGSFEMWAGRVGLCICRFQLLKL